MTFDLALTGDVILNRPVRDYADPRFHELADLLRDSTCSIAHFESTIHNYTGSEVYPAAEAGWTWMRSPLEIVEDLTWMGIDAVTLASNHSLDYSYGGLKETIEAFDRAGIKRAGTGNDLAAASSPTFLHTGGMRVGIISMASSFQPWARAGAARTDMPGRPGLNPLVFSYCGNQAVLDLAFGTFRSMGWWVTEVSDGEWWVNPAGLHNGITRFVLSDDEVLSSVVDEFDLARHRKTVRDARERCDLLIVHVHNHEWAPNRGIFVPPAFTTQLAHALLDEGADVFFAEGSHAPLRGIEIYNGKVIFYDPGDFVRMAPTVQKFPQDFYDRHHHELPSPATATPVEVSRARAAGRYHKPDAPVGGYRSARVTGGMVPVCRFDSDGALVRVDLHPFVWSLGAAHESGVPLAADGLEATGLLEYMQEISAEFGTTIEIANGRGTIRVGA